MLSEKYLLIIISLATSLLGLLGSVGIFISLIIQRKVERLQDILEELIDQANSEEQNLTGTIYRIVQKYQMHYLIPEKPVRTIMYYVDATIAMVILIWTVLHLAVIPAIFSFPSLPFLLPALGTIVILFFFRKLLKYAVNPLDNPLLNGIIPPPTKLRSLSFLSGYVNVSVKALLKQVRFNLLVEKNEDSGLAKIILKEELSFDDFFYYLSIGQDKCPVFVAFGKLLFSFPPDPITGKPAPLHHNINIPIGACSWENFQEKEIPAHLMLFPYGEKHPIDCAFSLTRQSNCYISINRPETTMVNSILFKAAAKKMVLLENKSVFSHLEAAKEHFDNQHSRCYFSDNTNPLSIQICTEEPFVN